MSIAIPDISPTELLDRFRGRVSDARPGYPEVIHLYLIDPEGAEWGFSTWDADYSPSDPAALVGKTVVSMDLVGPLGNVTIGFSDGTDFRVTMEPQTAETDPMNWTLHTPEGFILVWGPGDSWRLKRGDEPL
jgi:hypothetical protein